MEVPSRTDTRFANEISVKQIRLFITHMRLFNQWENDAVLHITYVGNLYFWIGILACEVV